MRIFKHLVEMFVMHRKIWKLLVQYLSLQQLVLLKHVSRNCLIFVGKDDQGLELLSGKVASNGMTFETVAKLLPSKSTRDVMVKGINEAEEIFKDLNKPLPTVRRIYF